MIIVLGTRKQYEVDSVCSKLENFTDICVVDYLDESEYSFELSAGRTGKTTIHINGVSLEDASSVWSALRVFTPKYGDSQDWADEVIASEQWRAVYRNIQYLSGKDTLNGIDAINKGYNKLYQLATAMDSGFMIPPSLVSNSNQRLSNFINNHENSITKSLGDPHYPLVEDGVSQQVIMTASVNGEMIDRSAILEPFPTLIQKDIAKDHELRVIVVRDKVMAFRIDPYQHGIMNTDYRRGGMMVDYKLVDLDNDTCQRVRSLHIIFGFFSASYDFIVSVDGQLTFLEVNPFGAWGYMDNLTSGLISKTICSEILNIAQITEDIK